jgi:hypothetical protein
MPLARPAELRSGSDFGETEHSYTASVHECSVFFVYAQHHGNGGEVDQDG